MTYTHRNIQELLPGISLEGLKRAMKEQGLPGRFINRTYYFDGDAVKAWLSHQETNPQEPQEPQELRPRRHRRKAYEVPDIFADEQVPNNFPEAEE